MKKNRRIVGAAAGCAVVVATLLGAPSARAADSTTCDSLTVCGVTGVGPSETAFIKIADLRYPGVTDYVFSKLARQ